MTVDTCLWASDQSSASRFRKTWYSSTSASAALGGASQDTTSPPASAGVKATLGMRPGRCNPGRLGAGSPGRWYSFNSTISPSDQSCPPVGQL